MNSEEFQDFLLKAAIYLIACDGHIDEDEISELRRIVETEIYFMGYDFEDSFTRNLKNLEDKGVEEINGFLRNVESVILTENQEIFLIEVLIRVLESDKNIEQNEITFIQTVKSKLKVSDNILIAKFPKQMNYLIDISDYVSNKNAGFLRLDL